MSAYVNLLGVIDAGKNQYHAEYLNERGRGYASSAEIWAETRMQMELLQKGIKDIGDCHKDMWQAAKDGNEDAFTALLGQLSRSSVQMATEWARLAAMAEIGLG